MAEEQLSTLQSHTVGRCCCWLLLPPEVAWRPVNPGEYAESLPQHLRLPTCNSDGGVDSAGAASSPRCSSIGTASETLRAGPALLRSPFTGELLGSLCLTSGACRIIMAVRISSAEL